MTTKKGEKTLGAVIRAGAGNLVLLPSLQYDEEEFTVQSDEDGEDDGSWNDAGIQYGKRLIKHLIEIDKSLRTGAVASPPPEWVKDRAYKLQIEASLEKELEVLSKEIEKRNSEKLRLEESLYKAGKCRRLLFETGKQLESAIVDTLRQLGFRAEGFKKGDSEFDVVFESVEGRFLGEAEGKDNRAINIDKLSQLVRNLEEDYSRDEISEYAKGVLFGNAYRNLEISKRGDFFTEKCVTSARRHAIALVRTTDLFPLSQFLADNEDREFAKNCRVAILSSTGLVEFPKVPTQKQSQKKPS